MFQPSLLCRTQQHGSSEPHTLPRAKMKNREGNYESGASVGWELKRYSKFPACRIYTSACAGRWMHARHRRGAGETCCIGVPNSFSDGSPTRCGVAFARESGPFPTVLHARVGPVPQHPRRISPASFQVPSCLNLDSNNSLSRQDNWRNSSPLRSPSLQRTPRPYLPRDGQNRRARSVAPWHQS